MNDIAIRIEGKAGRITLTRPQALNALNWKMCRAIDAALIGWRDDPAVQLVIIDAKGERAFCAGGDLAEIHAAGMEGNFDYCRHFWRDEYRMNARVAEYPKPVVSFMQGYCMGGGVGLGCHAKLRIVGNTSQIAMPECGIGLIPDVGGTMILARAPGRIGSYLGLTGARMGPADAIFAGFADIYRAEGEWPGLKDTMIATGQIGFEPQAPSPGTLAGEQAWIDRHFASLNVPDIMGSLGSDQTPFANRTRKGLARNSPLSMMVTLRILAALGSDPGIRQALTLEYRFTSRAMEKGELLEGIRAAIIDKDRNPNWRQDLAREGIVAEFMRPLGAQELHFEEEK
ncbi:MAG: enoyl-CoA hydratase/isomerase family protein [Pseudorhodobacter sp.]